MIEPRLVPIIQKGFHRTGRIFLGRVFEGVYLDISGVRDLRGAWPAEASLFAYSTHSSWWDPLVAAELAVGRMRRRTIAPMDEEQFRSYASLRYVGLFGVGVGDGPAAEKLVDEELRQNPASCVWVTPQGAFSPNERPQPHFKSGLSRWSARVGAVRVPVAIHYQLGMLPRPQVFVRVGHAVARQEGEDLLADSERLRAALDRETKLLLERVWDAHTGGHQKLDSFERIL